MLPLVASNVAVPVGKVYTPVSSAAVRVRDFCRLKVFPEVGEKPVTVAALPVVEPEEPDTLPVTLPVSGPAKELAVTSPAAVTVNTLPALIRLVKRDSVPVNSRPLTVPTAEPEALRLIRSEVLPVLVAGVWEIVRPEAVLAAAAELLLAKVIF